MISITNQSTDVFDIDYLYKILDEFYDFFNIPSDERIIKIEIKNEEEFNKKILKDTYAVILNDFEFDIYNEKIVFNSSSLFINKEHIIKKNKNMAHFIYHLLLHEFCHFIMDKTYGFSDGNYHNQSFYNFGNNIMSDFQKNDYYIFYHKKYDDRIINRVKKRYELLYNNKEFIYLSRKLENIPDLSEKEQEEIKEKIKCIKKEIKNQLKSLFF